MIDLSINKRLDGAGGDKFLLNVSFKVNKGELIALYGKSGSGKTSLLRMLAGLLEVDEGLISVNGEMWLSTVAGICMKPQFRKIGFVFQDYALFPNMTVRENLGFAIKNNKNDKIIEELMEVFELGDLKNSKPRTLSGGQKQRVALARALVSRPQVLILDEPLSALDAQLRFKLQDYILATHHRFELTTILVSHDIGEVIKMADRVVVLENGAVLNEGKPLEIFANNKVSGKFQFTGEVVQIQKEEFVFIVTVLIGSNIVKVVAEETEVIEMKAGDKVMVASKAFNPIIQKMIN